MKRATIGHAGRHARRDCRGGRASLAAIVANGFAPGCLGVIRRCEGAIQEVTAGPDGAADELAANANDAATARIDRACKTHGNQEHPRQPAGTSSATGSVCSTSRNASAPSDGTWTDDVSASRHAAG